MEIKWKKYIVGFFDIMGQSSKLNELGLLLGDLENIEVANEKKLKRIEKLTNETYEKVERFRHLFTYSFNIFKKLTINENLTSSPVELTEIKNIGDEICMLRFFSDSVMFYTPFNAENELLTRFRIAAMLYACTCVSIRELTTGDFFRGGIEIGAGLELGNGDLYGPVLNDSYRLEKEVADYPRIVVGKNLRRFIQKEQVVNSGRYLDSVLARIDDFCKKMIYQDDDGKFTIDYLGKKIADVSRSSYNQTSDSVKKGISKIETEVNEYINKQPDLANRLKKLLAYCESRMKFWAN